MWSIRAAQLAALQAAARRRFLLELRLHARRYFAEARALDDEALDRRSTVAIERAAVYGITGEREISLWLNLAFTFGDAFDADPRHPWAAAALHDPSAPGPRIRMSRLYRTAMQHAGDAPEAR